MTNIHKWERRQAKLDKKRRGRKSMKMDGKGTRTQYLQRIEKYKKENQ